MGLNLFSPAKREAAVLLQDCDACFDTLATDIPGSPGHKPLDLAGALATERAAERPSRPQYPRGGHELHQPIHPHISAIRPRNQTAQPWRCALDMHR